MPEAFDQSNGCRGGFWGGSQHEIGGGFSGEAGGFGDDGNALAGAIGAIGQVGDGEARGGRIEDRVRWGHAVQEP